MEARHSSQQTITGDHLEQVIAALPVAVYVCEAPGGTIRFCNRRASELWGREPRLGDPGERFCGSLRLLRTDGSPLPHASGPMAESLRTGEPRADEVVIERPDGSRIAVRIQASPLRDPMNRVTGAIAVVQEVIEQDHGTEPLRLNEARYRTIVEDQPDLVCRFLPDGTLTFANEAYCTYFGFRREDILGKRYTPVVHSDDIEAVQALIASSSPANPVVFIENRVLRADGVPRWTQWTNRALYDQENRLMEYQSTGRDITGRKQAEEDAARLAAIVESADAGIFGMTLNGVITSWNRAAERMFGYPSAEAIGRPIGFIIPPERSHEGTEILGRLRRGETVEHFETERVARDGRRIPVSLIVSPIRDARGRVIGISKIARDITERKRAERELQERESRFRLMADHAPVLIWVADPSNRWVYFNRTWLDFTGLPLEAQVGDGWLTLIHPDDRAETAARCQDHFDRRRPFTLEFRLRHASGQYRWVQDTGRPLFLPDGTFNGYIGSCVDIDARKAAEVRMEQAMQRESEARAAAEEASRLKDKFLAVVSHELRTPLNAMLGWARMLRDGNLPADSVPKALETIERNARMQAQLIEDLLDVSRILGGKLPLGQEPVNLGSVIHAAVEAVRPAATSKDIELQVDLKDSDATVSGDAGRLQQAVWNLLTNAVKFTPKGGRVDVELRRTESEAIVTVRDTGSGIPADALPFIFDRFRQADSRTARAHGGLGLGLTIVDHIAEAHGGAVRAHSAGPGQGATFTLSLPIRAGSASSAPLDTPAAECPNLTGRRVLVVDDDSDARELVRTILESCGAMVTTAASVAEALAVLSGASPDVLVGDIGMPDQDGYDLIRAVRAFEDFRRIPAIALSAYADRHHRDAALRAGFDVYLSKPVDPDLICDAILDVCGAGS
jgi:PAS domain S-box-containing protein